MHNCKQQYNISQLSIILDINPSSEQNSSFNKLPNLERKLDVEIFVSS